MDEATMRVELEKHHREGYVWALNCCGQNRVAAEEVLQKVYVKILAGRARFRGEASFKTWFLALIRHTAVDQWREENRRQANLTAYEANGFRPVERPDELLERSDMQAVVARGLALLPVRQQEIMRLVFYHDVSLSEAATVMGVAVGTARTHYERGKEQLRKFLETAKVTDESKLGRR